MKFYRIRSMLPLYLLASAMLLAACSGGVESTPSANHVGSDQEVTTIVPQSTTETDVTEPMAEADVPPTEVATETDVTEPMAEADVPPTEVATDTPASEESVLERQKASPPEKNEDLFPLLLEMEDSRPPRTMLTQARAGRLEDADCEDRLCAQAVYEVTASRNIVRVRFEQYLFYYPDMMQVEERITNMQSPGAVGGLTLHARPSGSKLSPNTIILEIENARALLTWYDLWEIFLFTENPDVETRAAIEALNHLAETQIEKLVDAGY